MNVTEWVTEWGTEWATEWATEWLDLGLTATLTGCAWLLAVLALRRPVGRWLGARFAYALWWAPLAALIAGMVPRLLPVGALPLLELPGLGALVDQAVGTVVTITASTAAAPTPVDTAPLFTVPTTLITIWLAGFVLSLGRLGWQTIRFARSVERTSQPLTAVQLDALSAGGSPQIPAGTCLRLSRHGPAVTGLLRPTLLLPEDFFDRYSAAQRALIVAHECHHLRRRDLAWLYLARLYRSVFWFNPIAYVAERALQLDQELSCDEYVLAAANRPSRRLYGETLLASVGARRPLPHAPYRPTFRQLKERTQMLRHHRRGAVRRLLGTLLVTLTVLVSAAYAGAESGSPSTAPELRAEVYALLSDIQAGISRQLETDDTDRTAFAGLLGELEAQADTFDPETFSDVEQAQLTNLSGYLAFLMKDYELAIDYYEPILNLVPEQAALHGATLKTIAQLHFALDQYDQAIVYLDRLEALNGEQADVLMLQGQARYQLDDFAGAAGYVDRAIARAEADGKVPREQWLQLQLATHDEIGDDDGVRLALTKLNRLYPKPDYGQRLEALDRT